MDMNARRLLQHALVACSHSGCALAMSWIAYVIIRDPYWTYQVPIYSAVNWRVVIAGAVLAVTATVAVELLCRGRNFSMFLLSAATVAAAAGVWSIARGWVFAEVVYPLNQWPYNYEVAMVLYGILVGIALRMSSQQTRRTG